jgi:hypothetical protein
MRFFKGLINAILINIIIVVIIYALIVLIRAD